MRANKTAVIGTNRALYQVDEQGQRRWRTAVDTDLRAVHASDDGRWIVGALADGTLRWWRGRDGVHVLTLLLDAEGPAELRRQVCARLEAVADSRVTDLHLWSVGQGAWTRAASVVSHGPTAPDAYKAALAGLPGIHHPMVEIHACRRCPGADGAESP